MEERRRDQRLPLGVTLELERIAEDNLITVKYLKVIVKDISRAGLGFVTDEDLALFTYYDTKLQIWTKEVLDVVIQVIRKEMAEDGKLFYGTQFIGLPEQNAAKIDIYQMLQKMNVEEK